MHARTIDIVFATGVILLVGTQGRLCVRKALIFANQIYNIHSVSTSAALKPKVHHVVDRCPDFRIFPVEIRLFGREQREVVLVGLGIVCPLQDLGVSASLSVCDSTRQKRWGRTESR